MAAKVTDPFAGKSYDQILAMYRGSQDAVFRRNAQKAMQAVKANPTLGRNPQPPAPAPVNQPSPPVDIGAGGGTPPKTLDEQMRDRYGTPIGTFGPPTAATGGTGATGPTGLNDLIGGAPTPTPTPTPIPEPAPPPPSVQPPAPIEEPTPTTSTPPEWENPFANEQYDQFLEEQFGPPGEDTSIPLIGKDEYQEAVKLMGDLANWRTNIKMPTREEMQALYDQAFQQQLSNLGYGVEERQARQQKAREQYLADRGIALGSEAYRGEQLSLAEQRAAEAAGLRAQAAQFAEARAAGEAQRAQAAGQLTLQEETARQQNMRERLASILGLGSQERQLSSTEQTERLRIGSNLKIARENIESSNLQFMQRLGLDEKTLAANMDVKAQELGIAREELAFRINESARNAKVQEQQFLKEFNQKVREFKFMSNLEAKKVTELIRSNKIQEAIARINAEANRMSAGAAGTSAQANLMQSQYAWAADRAYAVGQANIRVVQEAQAAGVKLPGVGGALETGSTLGFV